MVAKLVECADSDCLYGILTAENVSVKEVQEKIQDIKAEFSENGFEDWTIEDVLAELPAEWKVSFESAVGEIEI